jgi:hypothetical protein
MARKKSSGLRWLKVLLVLALIYIAVFFVWSRVRTFRVRGDNRTMWSFFEAPSGFQLAIPNRWRQWKQRERVAATIFWPCIQAEERWTNRHYWPATITEPERLLR